MSTLGDGNLSVEIGGHGSTDESMLLSTPVLEDIHDVILGIQKEVLQPLFGKCSVKRVFLPQDCTGLLIY